MKPMSGSPSRQQLLLFAAIGVVGWGVVSLSAMPLWMKLHHLEEQGMVSQKKLVRLRELANRRNVIDQAYQRYAAVWSKESEEVAHRAFLDELEQLAQADQLQLNLKPRPIEREGDVVRVGVELDVEAAQPALFAFLDRLFSQASLIELERLKISTTPSADHPLRATLVVNKVLIRP